MSALRWPPSIGMCAPLTKLARGDARNATRFATSCGVQIRPSGIERDRELVRRLLVDALVAGERLLEAVPAVGVDRARG